MSLSVDTEADTHDFTSRYEQLILTECLTLFKLSIWLTCYRHFHMICYVIHQNAQSLMLPSQALCQQPSIILTLIQYLINTFTKVPSQQFAAQNTRSISPLSPDMPEGKFLQHNVSIKLRAVRELTLQPS